MSLLESCPCAATRRRCRQRRRPVGLLLAVAIVALLSGHDAGGIEGDDPSGDRACWSLVEASSQRVVLEVTVGTPRWIPNGEAGGGWEVPGFPGRDYEAGRAWPSLHLPVAVPPKGDVTVRVRVAGLRRLPQTLTEMPPRRIGPPPGETAPDARLPDRESGEGAPAEWVDDAFRRWSTIDRHGFVARRPTSVSDYVRLLPLRILPIRPLPGGRLAVPERIRVEVRFAQSPPVPTGMRQSNRWEGVVANPDQAVAWRHVPAVPRRARGDSFGSATSDWLRIAVVRRGVYVLVADDLTAAGVDPSAVPLAELRLFCATAGALPESLTVDQLPDWMEPCALQIEDDDGDDVWDADTRIYFLGNGPDGWRTDLGLTVSNPEDRYYTHPYTAEFVYWLCWGGDFSSPPLRMEVRSDDPAGWPLRETATARVHVEESRVYDTRPRERHGKWDPFYHIFIRAGKTGYVSVDLPGIRPSSAATLRCAVWGASWASGIGWDDHSAISYVNGDSVAAAGWEDLDMVMLSGTTTSATVSSAINVSVPLRTSGDADIQDNIYLDWIEIDYLRELTATDDSLAFFVDADSAAACAYRIRGLTRAEDWLLLDASDPRAPLLLTPTLTTDQEGIVCDFRVIPAGDAAHLVLVQRDAAATPAAVARWTQHRDPSAPLLRERATAVDYLIVTSEEYWEAAEALQAHRSEHFPGPDGDSASVGRIAVVAASQIFDEFAGGLHDPTALRNFCAFARAYWRGGAGEPTLRYLLLLGNAYYDPRHHFGGGANDDVPSHHYYEWERQLNPYWSPAFFGDDWFALLDGPADEGLDLAVGRIPAATLQQANNMVAKIIAYDTDAPPGAWRTRVTLAADDVCQGRDPDGLGFGHMNQTERLSRDGIPADVRERKIYLYEYGADCVYDRKPEATADLLASLAEGTLLFNFIGHGSEVQLADERLVEKPTILALENYDRPFLMITASCAVGKFAHGGDGLGLNMIRIADRGALAVLSASSMAASTINAYLNTQMLQGLFPENTLRHTVAFGPALQTAKQINNEANDRRYNLFGDPASRFVVPGLEIELTVEDVPADSSETDVLVRGAPASVRGRIVDGDGLLVSEFDGDAQIWVLDSDIFRHPVGSSTVSDYYLPGARIFSGPVAVSAGEFHCSFFVPSALRTGERGPARIYAYAEESAVAGRMGNGALTDLEVPERVMPSSDVSGPTIELAWANPGVEPAPGSVLQASLRDSSGIYVAALAASRSVVVTISDVDERILVAEDLAAQVEFGADFREASLAYSLPQGLPPGELLLLALEASDNVSRRSRATLEFTLSGGGDRGAKCLGTVFALPNPIETETRFLCELAETADLEVTIYTTSGREIRSLRVVGMTPTRAAESGIWWDGRDADGDRLANGVYFYRMVARGCGGADPERIESLVILR